MDEREKKIIELIKQYEAETGHMAGCCVTGEFETFPLFKRWVEAKGHKFDNWDC